MFPRKKRAEPVCLEFGTQVCYRKGKSEQRNSSKYIRGPTEIDIVTNETQLARLILACTARNESRVLVESRNRPNVHMEFRLYSCRWRRRNRPRNTLPRRRPELPAIKGGLN